MEFVDCHYYRDDIEDFEGCPSLDYYGSGGEVDECSECKYRLENFKKLLEHYEEVMFIKSKK